MFKIKNEKVWILSDIHYAHLNLCKGTSKWSDTSGCRDFNNPGEMWEVIRNNINRLVKPDNILINLGDILFGDKTQLPNMLAEINCKNHLYIFGNHCDWLKTDKYKEFQTLFNLGCYDYKEVIIQNRLVILSHYLMKTWREQHKKSIQLGGHSHGTLPDDPNALSMDVGLDTCLFGHTKYTPYNADEIFSIMDNHKRCVVLDHHKDNK